MKSEWVIELAMEIVIYYRYQIMCYQARETFRMERTKSFTSLRSKLDLTNEITVSNGRYAYYHTHLHLYSSMSICFTLP